MDSLIIDPDALAEAWHSGIYGPPKPPTYGCCGKVIAGQLSFFEIMDKQPELIDKAMEKIPR